MKRILLVALPLAALTLSLVGHAAPPPAHSEGKKFDDFDKVVQGAKQYDGLFRLFQKEDRLYAEIRPDQLDKPFLCPIAIARGMGMGGYTLNFDEQWVLVFRRVGDRVHLVRRNVRFRAKKGSPAAHAVETTYADSVLLALRIVSVHPGRQSVLLNFNDVFMTDFAQLGTGAFDASRSTWHKIKTFPRNIELEVAATYAGGRRGRFGNDSVIDGRGTTVVIHYGLCELPDSSYHPRLADDRVGHFLSVVKDFSSDQRDTSFLRYINRWRLERAEPLDAKRPGRLSAPKKKIVFWIEKSVPVEYRAYVREGILEWNKAFEKIGFRDAIEVRQQESEDFDPEDVNYNTFRWITTDQGFAMGPSRANPLTGEIIDADIIFDASMVRFYRNEAHVFGKGEASREAISPIRTARMGWNLAGLDLLLQRGESAGWDDPKRRDLDPEARDRARAIRLGLCQCGPCLKRELNLLALTLADRDGKPGDPANVLPEELIGQAVKEVTMHEVGHTLGLRHNFKASTMLKNEDLHNPAITRKQGLVGSVMDYSPINLAPKGVKQGDYFTTTIGPYDYWAIEYAYKPLTGGTEGEVEHLQEIARRCAGAGLDYATDEDMFSSADPLVHVWDLGADPMRFAEDRMLLAEELLKKLADRTTEKGEGYQRTRQAFNILLQEFGNGAYLVSYYVGGEVMHRDHRGDPSGRDPMMPVQGDKQRAALKFLQDHLLSDRAFQFSPQLLRRLGADRWWHWGNEGVLFSRVDYPLHERVLAIQRVVLEHVLAPRVLSRIQNNALKADRDEKPLQLAEVFRSLTDGIWAEAATEKGGKKPVPLSVVRRNLQRQHLKDLSALVLGRSGSAPPDARSLARLHLREIDKRIGTVLAAKTPLALDDTSRAHLEECRERVTRVLNASMQISEP